MTDRIHPAALQRIVDELRKDRGWHRGFGGTRDATWERHGGEARIDANGRGISVPELSSGLKWKKQTVHRYIDGARQAGYDVRSWWLNDLRFLYIKD